VKVEVVDDEEEEQVEADEEEEEEEEAGEEPHEHCDINYVKNTEYTLLHANTSKGWGYCKITDTAPVPPHSRSPSCAPGDYVLIKGKNIRLK
jgi:hypothetical protein